LTLTLERSEGTASKARRCDAGELRYDDAAAVGRGYTVHYVCTQYATILVFTCSGSESCNNSILAYTIRYLLIMQRLSGRDSLKQEPRKKLYQAKRIVLATEE
jgi:hypothetical protein